MDSMEILREAVRRGAEAARAPALDAGLEAFRRNLRRPPDRTGAPVLAPDEEVEATEAEVRAWLSEPDGDGDDFDEDAEDPDDLDGAWEQDDDEQEE